MADAAELLDEIAAVETFLGTQVVAMASAAWRGLKLSRAVLDRCKGHLEAAELARFAAELEAIDARLQGATQALAGYSDDSNPEGS